MLEYGINFNTKDGAAKAEKELEELQKRWQKLLADNPLKLEFEVNGKKVFIEQQKIQQLITKTGSVEQQALLRKELGLKRISDIENNIANKKMIAETRVSNLQADNIRKQESHAIRMETAQKRLEDMDRRRAAAIDRQTLAYKNQSQVVSQLKSYAASFLSIYAATRLTKSIADITGEFELQKVSLQAILQDAEKGEAIFERIKNLAVISPFQFKDLTSYTKQLAAFSVPYEELYDTTKMLADISAGVGADMSRIILAYGQTRSAEWLRASELRQYTELGIPLVAELAKKFTELRGTVVSAAEVFDLISDKKVPFEMVRDVLTDMTSEGGMFYKMQEKQAATLAGKISNLKDRYEQMLAEIGGKGSDVMGGAVDITAKLMEHYDAIGRILLSLVATYGAYRAALVATFVYEQFMTKAWTAKIRVMRLAVATQKLLNAAMAVHPVTIATTAIIGLTTALVLYTNRASSAERAAESFNEQLEKRSQAIEEERNKVQELMRTLNDETRTRFEKEQALKDLQRIMPDIFKNLDIEAAKVLNLTDLMKLYNEQVERKNYLEQRASVDEAAKLLSDKEGALRWTVKERQQALAYMGRNSSRWTVMNTPAGEIVKDLRNWVQQANGELSKYEVSFLKSRLGGGLPETVKAVSKTTKESIDAEKDALKEREEAVKLFLDHISNQVDEYQRKFNIWESIYQATGKDTPIKFDVLFENKPSLKEYIKEKMQEIADDKLDLNVDFLTADFNDILGGVTLDEQKLSKLKEFFNTLRDFAVEEEKRDRELVQNYQSFADQRLEIERKLNVEILKLEQLRAKDGDKVTDDRISKARQNAKSELETIQKEILNKYGLDTFVSDGDVSDFVKSKIKAALPLFKSLATATRGELDKIKTVISDIELPQELLDDFKAAGGDVDVLLKLIEELKNQAGTAVKTRLLDDFLRDVDKVISSVGKLGAALEGSANKLLSSMGTFLSGISSGLDGVTNLFKDNVTTMDKLQVGISGFATILDTINKSVSENKQAQKEWNDAIEESVQNMRLLRIEELAYKQASIFGMDNPLAPAIAGMKQYARSMEELNEIQKQFGSGLVEVGKQKVPSGSAYAGFIGGGAAAGAAVGSLVPVVGTAIGAVVGGLVGGFAASISALFGSKASTKLIPVYKRINEHYKWIYDKDFNLNPQIIADYKKLDEETRKIVDNWEEIKEKAQEAQEKVEETLKNIAGSIGEDLYSALIEAFDNNDLDAAMRKFRDSVDKILSELASRMLFNAVFGDILAEGENRMKGSLSGDGDQDIVDDIDWIGDEMEKRVDVYLAGLSAWNEKLGELNRDLTFGADKTSNLTGISKSIPNITEDTALILAGYLDNMRMGAQQYYDFMRGEHLSTMNEMTLNQSSMIAHLESIKHNTKATADSTGALNESIKKVLVADTDGWKLNVKA